MLLQLTELAGTINLINLVFWLLIAFFIIIIVLYPIKKIFDIRTSKRQGDRAKRRVK